MNNTEASAQSISVRVAGALGIILLAAGFALGYTVAPHSSSSTVAVGAPQDVDFGPVWKAWKILDEHFVPAAVSSTTPMASTTKEKDVKRVYGMISGMAASLNDPYTFFLPPVENAQFGADMSGVFQGVGMEIEIKDQVLTVVSPLKGSPAEKAGMKSGDKIFKIDGKSTQGLDVGAAVKKIRGPKGTQVVLTVLREGWNGTKDISVTRDVINVPIVVTKKLPNGVFQISVATFTSNSPDLFRDALREFVKSGDKKLILDLRGNPGGYLDAAVSMASWFLPSGSVIVTEGYANPADNVVHRSAGYNIFTSNLKMVILVDKGSASASEILADALRGYHIAQLVGTNTFGKGVVQQLFDITPDTTLKVTVARWLGPDGLQIPHDGLVPDVMATTSEESIKAHKDLQLDKALEILNK